MPRMCVFVLLLLMSATTNVSAQYNPLELIHANPIATEDFTVVDSDRKREIPIRVFIPDGSTAAPIVMFSHGLGGARTNNAFLGNHWAARGYVAIFVQHPGSDESVWRNLALTERMSAMQQAASPIQLVARCLDVSRVIDELQRWNQMTDHPLHQKLDLEKIGMTGHSFGAHTTQALCGQNFPLVRERYRDKRLKCAIAFSPSSPLRGSAKESFADVQVPWLLMTGTRDTVPIGGQTVESRLAVYPNLPDSIAKFELVLYEAEHSAFSERSLPNERGRRNPNHHRAILAISSAFLDAFLKEDDAAKNWLVTDQVKSVLEADDRWQFHLPK